jgi:5S rRNA maturation endonuclease (ribonuclease M5)
MLTCLNIAIAAALKAGKPSGVELSFHCPGPGHADGDQHASLFINPKKNKWMCGPCAAQGTAWQLAAFLGEVHPGDKPAVLRWLEQRGLSNSNSSTPKSRIPDEKDPAVVPRIVNTYDYTDETSTLLYQIVRYTPKGFRQRRPDGNGGWTWNIDGVRRLLYRLPDALKAETVYVVEGEKDVESLRAIGMIATCNPGGAGKWRREYAECLRGKHVIIIPDNDDAGRKHASQVAESLAGKVASIRTLELSGLAQKGDVSDWLVSGGTRQELEQLAAAAPEFVPSPAKTETAGTMRFTRVGDLLNEPEEEVRWLVEDHLPMGGDSLLVAKPKVGKSTLARCLALSVARGGDFLGRRTTQGTVFYLALEEKRSEVKRHFRAMGARADDPILIFCAPSPADGLAQLRDAAQREKPVLIIVDPLFRFTKIKDGNDYAAVTNALEPLHAFARDCGAHVQAVHHAGKRGDGGDSVLGSTAIFAAVDTLLLMKRNDKYRTLSSIQRYGTDLEEITLEYDIESRTLSAGVAKADADEAETARAIIDYLATQLDAVDERTIQGAIEGRTGVKSKALRRLVEEQRIRRTGSGKKGDPYLYKNSAFSPPDINREPEKPEFKNPVINSNNSANAGSQDFGLSENFAETREPVFSGSEERL